MEDWTANKEMMEILTQELTRAQMKMFKWIDAQSRDGKCVFRDDGHIHCDGEWSEPLRIAYGGKVYTSAVHWSRDASWVDAWVEAGK